MVALGFVRILTSALCGIDASENSMRFEFAATSFTEPQMTEYQVLLEGYDKQWSKWSTETRKDYTGLPGRRYTFRVKARNLYGELGDEASFSFRVKTPGFLQWWAFFYLLLSGIANHSRGGEVAGAATRVKGPTSGVGRAGTYGLRLRKQAEALKEMDRVKKPVFCESIP